MVSEEQDLGAIAKAIIDSNSYMAIGTADERGQPRVSPPASGDRHL